MSKGNNEYFIIDGSIQYPKEVLKSEIKFIKEAVTSYKSKKFTIVDLDKFLKKNYFAEKIDLPDINSCTKKGLERYNKYCKTVRCISEEYVFDEDYIATYKIKRNNLKSNEYTGDCYVDTVIIVGSKDKVHPDSFYIGGGSERLGLQMNILCNNVYSDN